MLIDTHAHLDDKQFDRDREEMILRTFASGIETVINIGAGLGSSQRSVDLAKKYENIFAAVGLHPHYFNQYREGSFDKKHELENLLLEKKVVAIGEVGLDYHFYEEEKKDAEKLKEIQKNGFLYQIKLAVEHNLPLIIHCRKAYPEVLEILTQEKKNYGEKLLGVMHSYLGRATYAQEFINLGFRLSFSGVITYARDYDKVIAGTNLENILIETDCPYLTPAPYRGERNEPAYVSYVAKKIAELKGLSLTEVEKITTANAKSLFNLP